MNSNVIKVSVALVATAASLVGFTSIARAGEGGVAGAAAFTVNGTQVTGVAVSAAVGKEDAAAAAFNYDPMHNLTGVANSAFAIGTAGVISATGIGDPEYFNINALEDSDRGTAQENSFNEGFSIQIGTGSGDSVVTVPPAPAPTPAL